MQRVVFVPMTALCLREPGLAALTPSLPSLHPRAAAIVGLPPLGVLTLAGMTPPPWEHDLVPCDQLEPRGLELVVERILARRPALAALSPLTASAPAAYHVADRLRSAGVRVVLGGIHATACPQEAAAHADAVCLGDGEAVWPDVLADAAAGALLPFYRPAAPYVFPEDDTGVVPRFDLYTPHSPTGKARFAVQTERGCPLACEFCAASRLLGPFRQKPLAAVRRELAAIRSVSRRPILELADDNTFAGDRDPGPLLDALAESRAKWFTEVDWRIAEVPGLARRMAQAGCVQALIGLESAVFRYAGMGPKTAEFERMLEAVRAIQAEGVAVLACFIVGGEGETRDSLARLGAFLAEAPFADVQVTLQTPFPGTALHRRLEKAGRLLPDRGWEYYTLMDVVYQPDMMSVAELEAGCRELAGVAFGPGPAARHATVREEVACRQFELSREEPVLLGAPANCPKG